MKDSPWARWARSENVGDVVLAPPIFAALHLVRLLGGCGLYTLVKMIHFYLFVFTITLALYSNFSWHFCLTLQIVPQPRFETNH